MCWYHCSTMLSCTTLMLSCTRVFHAQETQGDTVEPKNRREPKNNEKRASRGEGARGRASVVRRDMRERGAEKNKTRAALLRGLIEAVATREENSDQGDAVTPRHHVVNVGAHYEPRGSKGARVQRAGQIDPSCPPSVSR